MATSGTGPSSTVSGLSVRGLDRAQEKTALRAAELLVRLESAEAASPTMALLLAIMVAGAGQLYLRQYIAGVLAFLVCLVLGFGGAIPFALSHVYSIRTSMASGDVLIAFWLSSFIGAMSKPGRWSSRGSVFHSPISLNIFCQLQTRSSCALKRLTTGRECRASVPGSCDGPIVRD